jgi:hypothetical protein
MPPDFPEMFVLLGHKTIEEHYVTSWRPVKRWMSEYGEAELIQLRRAYLRKLAASRGQRMVTGRKPGVRFGGFPEMLATDPALAFMPVRQERRAWRKEVWVPFDGRPKPDEFADRPIAEAA